MTSCDMSWTTATFFEIQPAWAANIITGFARLGGTSVGVVGQQPSVLAGALDIDASVKAARFVRTCDAFNVPLVTFVDVPGFLPGVGQEHGGIIRHGAKLLYAYCRSDRAEADGHHAQGLRRRVRRHEQQAHPRRHEPRMADGRDRGDGRRGCGQHHREGSSSRPPTIRSRSAPGSSRNTKREFANPYIAAARGYVDDVIKPSETRPRLIAAPGDAGRQARHESAERSMATSRSDRRRVFAQRRVCALRDDGATVPAGPHREPRRDRRPDHPACHELGIEAVAVY